MNLENTVDLFDFSNSPGVITTAIQFVYETIGSVVEWLDNYSIVGPISLLDIIVVLLIMGLISMALIPRGKQQ